MLDTGLDLSSAVFENMNKSFQERVVLGIEI